MQDYESAGAYQTGGENEMTMNQNGYFMAQPKQQHNPNMQQPQMAYQQRTRSLPPPKKGVRPTY